MRESSKWSKSHQYGVPMKVDLLSSGRLFLADTPKSATHARVQFKTAPGGRGRTRT